MVANARATAPATQMLLVPFTWETSLSVRSWVNDNLEPLKKMGFVLEPFGGNTFLVKGTPAHLGDRYDLHSLLDGLTDLLNDPSDRRGRFGNDVEHRIAAMTACKAAVKAGDPLALPECSRLLAEIALCEAPYTCPHGRPTMIRLSYSELETRFRRT
jgi:DNA mismatch repair protein MutL